MLNRGIHLLLAQAIEPARQALLLNPRYSLIQNQLSSVYNQRGVTFFQAGLLKDALKNFTEAIRVQPRLAAAYNNRGSTYHAMGEVERAIDDYDESIRRSPRLSEAYANRARAFAVLNKDAEAQQDFYRALELGFIPESPKEDLNLTKPAP